VGDRAPGRPALAPESRSLMNDVVIAATARTAIGGYGKTLKDIPPTELGATTAKAALERAGIEPAQVDQVIYGNVIHTGREDMYMARVVGINAGVPKEAPAMTLNRLCGTGVQVVISAAQAIAVGDADIVLAGGAESMSRGPYWMPAARWGARMGETPLVDVTVGALTDPFHGIHMGVTAENLAKSHHISRAEQDAFAVRSHELAAAATAAGKFADEIVPVEVRVRRDTVAFTTDEHVRSDISLDALAKLPTVFSDNGDGTVTAGNAAGINDAAASAVVMSAAKAQELGAPVRARIVAWGICGVEPATMGIGPVPAVGRALAKAGLSLDDMDVIELNEAFAAQSLAVLKDLDLVDDPRVNPNGGAIALGHPVGATGTILVGKILGEMEREDHKLGLVTACIGGGQGIALVLGRD
jgi:acetyl-CoA C-acetyltransferase